MPGQQRRRGPNVRHFDLPVLQRREDNPRTLQQPLDRPHPQNPFRASFRDDEFFHGCSVVFLELMTPTARGHCP